MAQSADGAIRTLADLGSSPLTSRVTLRCARTAGKGCVLRGAGPPRRALIAYSLGNFATAMFTLHCRTGMVLSLTLSRDESGRVSWQRPEAQLVYNEPRDPATRQRRLVLLESYLRERERHGDRALRLREMGAFLHAHLLGAGA